VWEPISERRPGFNLEQVAARSAAWGLDIYEAAGGRFFLLKPPSGASHLSPGRRQRQELGTAVPVAAALGQGFHEFLTLSLNTFSVLGERDRVRGPQPVGWEDSRFVPINLESNETQD
jgi:hypothetical protein